MFPDPLHAPSDYVAFGALAAQIPNAPQCAYDRDRIQRLVSFLLGRDKAEFLNGSRNGYCMAVFLALYGPQETGLAFWLGIAGWGLGFIGNGASSPLSFRPRLWLLYADVEKIQSITTRF